MQFDIDLYLSIRWRTVRLIFRLFSVTHPSVYESTKTMRSWYGWLAGLRWGSRWRSDHRLRQTSDCIYVHVEPVTCKITSIESTTSSHKIVGFFGFITYILFILLMLNQEHYTTTLSVSRRKDLLWWKHNENGKLVTFAVKIKQQLYNWLTLHLATYQWSKRWETNLLTQNCSGCVESCVCVSYYQNKLILHIGTIWFDVNRAIV